MNVDQEPFKADTCFCTHWQNTLAEGPFRLRCKSGATFDEQLRIAKTSNCSQCLTATLHFSADCEWSNRAFSEIISQRPSILWHVNALTSQCQALALCMPCHALHNVKVHCQGAMSRHGALTWNFENRIQHVS